VTAEQRTQVRQAIVAESAPRVNVTFNISIGTVIPQPQLTVLRACPAPILTFLDQLRTWGCRYFVLPDGRIVLVRADTNVIVLIIAA
jgi:hypothetical protein